MRSITDLKKIVLESQDKNELYSAEIELTEMISNLYAKVENARNSAYKVQYKGELSVAISIKDVCRDRQSELREQASKDADAHNRMNYNFRMAAKAMLTKETYENILVRAALPRKEVKEQTKELRSNRVSE